MSKHKFSAQPIKKYMFNNNTLPNTNKKENRKHNNISNSNFKQAINNINININIVLPSPSPFNENENSLNNLNNITSNLTTSSSKFKAKPLPNFIPLEVKKSSKELTQPISPKLITKSRSLKRAKVCMNATSIKLNKNNSIK
jgi:hypothetical protein